MYSSGSWNLIKEQYLSKKTFLTLCQEKKRIVYQSKCNINILYIHNETLEFFSITYSNTCAPTEYHSWLGLALTCKPTKISDVATTLWLRSRSCFLAILAFAPCRYPVCWKNNNYIIPYDEPLMRFSLRSYMKPFPHLLRHQYVAKKFPFHECEVC